MGKKDFPENGHKKATISHRRFAHMWERAGASPAHPHILSYGKYHVGPDDPSGRMVSLHSSSLLRKDP